MTLTREQREALKRVFDRGPIMAPALPGWRERAMTYLQFRRQAYSVDDCLMVAWNGMWLGIEPDGYTHS